MKNKIFFLAGILISIFLTGFVVGESCEIIGEVDSSAGKYCDADNVWKVLVENGGACLNNYECQGDSCVEGICQSKSGAIAGGLEESASVFQDILNLLLGVECDGGEEKCDGTEWFMCGENNVWESQGQVNGECGYTTPNGGGGGGGGGASMVIDFISPKNGFNYSSLTIPLQVKDTRNRAKFWKYSLNGGSKVSFTPDINIQAVLGSNTLEVYASKTSSFSSEVKKKISFSVVQNPDGVCGDDVCDIDEDCDVCSDDCGECFDPDLSRCGDGVCDTGESSATCSEDCEAKKSLRWVWILLLIIIVLGVLFAFGYFIYRRRKQKNSLGNLGSISELPEYS